MSKSLVGVKSAWAVQEEAFKANLPLMKNNNIGKNTHLIETLWQQYFHLQLQR